MLLDHFLKGFIPKLYCWLKGGGGGKEKREVKKREREVEEGEDGMNGGELMGKENGEGGKEKCNFSNFFFKL